jgi:hypothetical protein
VVSAPVEEELHPARYGGRAGSGAVASTQSGLAATLTGGPTRLRAEAPGGGTGGLKAQGNGFPSETTLLPFYGAAKGSTRRIRQVLGLEHDVHRRAFRLRRRGALMGRMGA